MKRTTQILLPSLLFFFVLTAQAQVQKPIDDECAANLKRKAKKAIGPDLRNKIQAELAELLTAAKSQAQTQKQALQKIMDKNWHRWGLIQMDGTIAQRSSYNRCIDFEIDPNRFIRRLEKAPILKRIELYQTIDQACGDVIEDALKISVQNTETQQSHQRAGIVRAGTRSLGWVLKLEKVLGFMAENHSFAPEKIGGAASYDSHPIWDRIANAVNTLEWRSFERRPSESGARYYQLRQAVDRWSAMPLYDESQGGRFFYYWAHLAMIGIDQTRGSETRNAIKELENVVKEVN